MKNFLLSKFKDVEDKSLITYFSYFPAILQNNLVELLPSDHGLYYPLKFSSDKTKFWGNLNFYNKVFFDNYVIDRFINEKQFSIEEILPKKEKVLFVNVIDNCFGHSFQKLLNLINLDQSYGTEYDIVVIVQKNISHFVPNKFAKVTVKLGYVEAQKCYNLLPILERIKPLYKDYDFAALDTYAILPSKADLKIFFPFSVPRTEANKFIVFYYRKDLFRSWTANSQNKHIDLFFQQLEVLFTEEVKFVVVGDKDQKSFKNKRILDRRVADFSPSVDLEYNYYFENSILTIGLIGSNMLLPSLLSARTIHLVPSTKITIIAEEIINSVGGAISNTLESLYLISANATLSDYSPKRLANEVKMLMLTSIAKEYKHNAFKNLDNGVRLSQFSYFEQYHPYFNYKKAYEFKKQLERSQNKIVWLYFHLFRLKKLFKLR